MSYKTMKQSQDWRQNYNWMDKNDNPVHEEKLEENEFQPKVLKDQVVKFYKRPKTITLKNGTRIKSYGVIDGPLFSAPQPTEAQ